MVFLPCKCCEKHAQRFSLINRLRGSMGADWSMMGQQPPPGSTVFVIESDECCTNQTCKDRSWDPNMPQPPFVSLSSSEWINFVETMGGKVRSYKKDGYGLIAILLGVFLGTALFHPVIGVAGRSISGMDEDEERRRLGEEPQVKKTAPI